MNNKQKYDLIAQLKEYWETRYPDAFLQYPDGREVFREDLLDYCQDQRIQELERKYEETNKKEIQASEVLGSAILPFKDFTKDIQYINAVLKANEDKYKAALKQIQFQIVEAKIPKMSMAPLYVYTTVWPIVMGAVYYILVRG